jgi:glycine/D-amino acid oxidase-like deaminating enzyme
VVSPGTMDSASLDPAEVDIAIVGAGFCGSMLTVNLLRKAKEEIAIALIERSGSFGRGSAWRFRTSALSPTRRFARSPIRLRPWSKKLHDHREEDRG